MADRWRRGFLALSASVFTDPLLWDRREYCPLRAAIDLCGMASFAKRDFEEKGVALKLEVRETRPLSTRFLMERWGWKSTATVARFLSSLETRTGTLVKHRTTRLGNTYLVGERLLALCGETPNETANETPNETVSETKVKKIENNDLQNVEKGNPLPTGVGETRARVREDTALVLAEPAAGARVTGAQLFEQWVATRAVPPSPARPQLRAAEEIARRYTPDQIRLAVMGMPYVWPFNKGEPWDLVKLLEKFSDATEASKNHPERQMELKVQRIREHQQRRAG